jgi:hypothetical protein
VADIFRSDCRCSRGQPEDRKPGQRVTVHVRFDELAQFGQDQRTLRFGEARQFSKNFCCAHRVNYISLTSRPIDDACERYRFIIRSTGSAGAKLTLRGNKRIEHRSRPTHLRGNGVIYYASRQSAAGKLGRRQLVCIFGLGLNLDTEWGIILLIATSCAPLFSELRISMTNVLIITATIHPPAGVPYLVRTDPLARLADYERGFRFYITQLTTCFDRIVFVENSGSDVTRFARIAAEAGVADKVDVFSFNGLNHPPEYGKAYGEFKLLDHLHANLYPLSNDVIYWKVTGRYVIKNIASIVRKADSNIDLVCHSRDYRLRMKDYRTPWADMYLFGYAAKGYQQLLRGIYERFRQDLMRPAPEQRFREIIDEQIKAGTIRAQRRFRCLPLIDGIRGSDNRGYLDDANLRKMWARRMISILMPWIWL